jgi:putative endonuclease
MKGFIYILTNKHNTVLYTGVTCDLIERIREHKNKEKPGSFTAKYNLNKLVYFECLDTIGEAIKREKQIKAGSRKKKEQLILSMNSEWKDIYNDPGFEQTFNLLHSHC